MVKNVSLYLQGHPIPQELNDLLLNNTEEKRLYRVSRPILNHNIDQMSLESAFHWISHLLTQDYTIETEYEIRKEFSLVPKSIAEKLVFVIPVSMAQMFACDKNKPC